VCALASARDAPVLAPTTSEGLNLVPAISRAADEQYDAPRNTTSGSSRLEAVRMSRWSPLPAGFVPPCLPSGSKAPPSGKEWLHEIKHDGFRIIARKVVKLYSRPGNDLTKRFPLIVEAVAKLRASSCIIDGEAVACGENGIACFDLILRW